MEGQPKIGLDGGQFAVAADGYLPNIELEDDTWNRIVCSCGTDIALTDGRLLRYRCVDRRCRKPGHARYVYLDITANPPHVVAEKHVPVRPKIKEDRNDGR